MKKIIKILYLLIGIIFIFQNLSWAGIPKDLKTDWILEKYKNGNATTKEVLRITSTNIKKLDTNHNGALELFEKLKYHGIYPDLITYNSIIHVYAQAGNGEMANRLLQEMTSFGVSPNLITYSSVFHAYAQAGNGEMAYQLLQAIKNMGVSPNLITYNSIIHAYAQTGNGEMAYAVLQEMRGEGISPDVETYNSIINAYNRAGNREMAYAVFQVMKINGFYPADWMIYNSMMQLQNNIDEI